jgi:hypothetical protein
MMGLFLTIKKSLQRSPSTFDQFRKLNRRACKLLYAVSPVLLVSYRYLIARARLPNLSAPQTFDEKLLWLTLYCQDPLKTQCADKLGLRSYVENMGCVHILPKMIGVYERVEEIDFESLPDRFVLKCTHGYNANLICRDKSQLNIPEAKRKLHVWLNESISKVTGELHYAPIVPRIICEEFLDDLVNEVPVDYKIYCFGGKAHCTMVCTERGFGSDPKIDFYDREWKAKLHYFKDSRITDRNRTIPRPSRYEEMLEYAEHLSKPFPFVRMDFYEIQGKVIIGEMTFTPHGCIDLDYTDDAQALLGGLIDLPRQVPTESFLRKLMPRLYPERTKVDDRS